MTPKDYAITQIVAFRNLAVNSQKETSLPINKCFYLTPADKSMQVIIDSTSTQVMVDSKGELLIQSSPIIYNGQGNMHYYNVFLQEAQIFDIGIIPPDINKSQGLFSVEYDGHRKSIIFPIAAIKNVARNFGLVVEEIRRRRGDFKSIIDFIENIEPKLINKRLLENIIKAGCFDSMHSNRNSLLQSVPKIMAYSISYHAEQKSNQFSLISVKLEK